MTTEEMAQQFILVWDSFEILDEAIVSYLDKKGGEYQATRPMLDKHVEEVLKGLKLINGLIKTITEWEAEDNA